MLDGHSGLASANPTTAKENGNVTSSVVSPNVWTVMQKWIDALPTTSDTEVQRQTRLQSELEWVSHELGDTAGVGSSKFVFAHCDLLSGNVIILPESSQSTPSSRSSTASNSTDTEDSPCSVAFIDYEYATPTPAAFDIANHFAEWGGFECDFGVLPTRAQRRDFLTHYLRSFNEHKSRPDADIERELGQLSAEVDAFRGLPGFYWGIWALIQATISQIDFDYASYAEVRLGEYWDWKAETSGQREKLGRQTPLREKRWAQEE